MDKLPLPTDNIFKFYALLGLLAFFFAIAANIVIYRSTNDYLYRSSIEVEALKAAEKKGPADTAKQQMLEALMKNAVIERNFFGKYLDWLTIIGAVGVMYGMTKWHSVVQPMQDRLTQLQIEKLQREMLSLPPLPPTPEAAVKQKR